MSKLSAWKTGPGFTNLTLPMLRKQSYFFSFSMGQILIRINRFKLPSLINLRNMRKFTFLSNRREGRGRWDLQYTQEEGKRELSLSGEGKKSMMKL